MWKVRSAGVHKVRSPRTCGAALSRVRETDGRGQTWRRALWGQKKRLEHFPGWPLGDLHLDPSHRHALHRISRVHLDGITSEARFRRGNDFAPTKWRKGNLALLSADWFEQHFLRVNEVFALVVCEFKVLSKNDGAGRTRFLAVAAEDAPEHVDLISFGVPLAG